MSEPPSPKDIDDPNDLTIKTMTSKIKSLRDEVRRLRGQLIASEKERKYSRCLTDFENMEEQQQLLD